MKLIYGDIINEIRFNSYPTGRGVGVAVFDTGVYPHEDLKKQIIGFKDCIKDRKRNQNNYDNNGHGTHIAGIIAGSGASSGGKFRGMAPHANIIGIKVLNYKGIGKVEYIAEGVSWLIKNKELYNIKIANFSVGGTAEKEDEKEIFFTNTIRKLADAGIIVVAAAGNNGPDKGSITVPGICKEVITVGSSDDEIPVKIGNYNEFIKDYSGRGKISSIYMKPDITAPGSYITSCHNSRKGYTVKSGTSMATAVITGAICMYLEKHKFADVEEVRKKLCITAYDNGREEYEQGCGLINIKRFLE